MRARYYNPEIKRFINQDILLGNIIDSTTLNRYSYVNGNPISLIDLFGLESQSSGTYNLGQQIGNNIAQAGTHLIFMYLVMSDSLDPRGLIDASIASKTKGATKQTTTGKRWVEKDTKDTLPDWVEKSFENSEYKTVVTQQDLLMYRTYGGKAKMDGTFVTSSPAQNRIQAKIDLALLPEWKNSREFEATILVPKGTTINVGKVAPQTTDTGTLLRGGAEQILLPQNYPSSWIIGNRKVPSR